ncbi:P-loop containing nucleoside triphosphate hydrolase protein [Epithele typhae]|uniref:P-loop containing nucleoside triphosphate hydrolase protein n=1 Tax=Epithele typhae TaxID=378194 RepID=UPI0020076128|nr:P-loop containing nucleoside triphosphate hydrolase protein [Epithele typhae]KAH9920558.1 P-loop containing nucleoside triphosphate hydrolase protein [Epithele typhae]
MPDSSQFVSQFCALCVKNWLILFKHPFASLSLFRCLIGPIAIGILLAYSPSFTSKPDIGGLGSMVPIRALADTFDARGIMLWSDDTNSTTTGFTANDVVARMTAGFSSKQLAAFQKVTTDEIAGRCVENPNGKSRCFAAVTFDQLPARGNNKTINYTIRVDESTSFVDIKGHNSDYEVRVLPVQWAVESAIIEIQTGTKPPTPLEWPFIRTPTAAPLTRVAPDFLKRVGFLLQLPFYICLIGIAYHIPGAATAERTVGLTSHMKAMGLSDTARVLSWHLSLSLAYLPAWLVLSIVWKVKLFTFTSYGLILALCLLTGFATASFSMFIMAPFGKSPSLAAILSTLCCLVPVTITMFWTSINPTAAAILTFFFPTFFFGWTFVAIVNFETFLLPASLTEQTLQDFPPPTILPMLIAVIISIFFWPVAGALIERWRFDPWNPFGSRAPLCGRRTKDQKAHAHPPGTAISIRGLEKSFQTSVFRRKSGIVTAVQDLTLDIPEHGIFALLGANGAGKSTLMAVLGGLTGRTHGTVLYGDGVLEPARGSVGIVPQKNVLFDELSCLQTLRVWREIKTAGNPGAPRESDADLEGLLRDCDLAEKIHYPSGKLSGGQKRKLQLAIGLVGGSSIVLVDEATSGVDPISRRAIWKTLAAVKDSRAIVFTTHFLDEADLLADYIAVLASPGKLVAHGTSISLKSTRGEGYKLRITFNAETAMTGIPESYVLKFVQRIAPATYATVTGPRERVFHLKTTDLHVVKKVLEDVDKEKARMQISSYSVSAASIEDIFLELMDAEDKNEDPDNIAETGGSAERRTHEKVELTTGVQRSVLGQALTICYKRLLIIRRSWLAPLLALTFVIIPSVIPLKFLATDGNKCDVINQDFGGDSLYLATSPLQFFFGREDFGPALFPPDALAPLNISGVLTNTSIPFTSNTSFVEYISRNFTSILTPGLSIDLDTGAALLSWNAYETLSAATFLNAASNLLLNHALNSTGAGTGYTTPLLITPTIGTFASKSLGDLTPLAWAAVFSAAMAVFPGFFALYVARERRSEVQAMQFSNGLSNPAGLWLGHLMFDAMATTFAATLLVIVWAGMYAFFFHGLVYLWLVVVLYGIASILYAYLFTLYFKSPIGAWAAIAVWHVILFLLYTVAYFLARTYGDAVETQSLYAVIHFTVGLVSPLPSLVRASFIATNLFSLLCVGEVVTGPSLYGDIMHYGGPILYLIIQPLIYFGILVYADSFSLVRSTLIRLRTKRLTRNSLTSTENIRLTSTAGMGGKDVALRVRDVSKSFGAFNAVEDVSFNVSKDTIFALLGPNGAGKTTTFNMIRGDMTPDSGEIFVNGHSVVANTKAARFSLGVCPQFTAIDAQLSVRQHLRVYARLKGLQGGAQVDKNVDAVMRVMGLRVYADRLANKLSGGNQRKLALAIALIGNPSVVLVDEFSTGVDAKMKRDMWSTLKHVAPGKAFVITTHSMEEASTLASDVGIISQRLLAVDSTDALMARYARYLVHFPGRTREDIVRAQEVMARIPGARLCDDVATRFEVPVGSGTAEGVPSLAALFGLLADAGVGEYAVGEASLESVFMQVIRDNDSRPNGHGKKFA